MLNLNFTFKMEMVKRKCDSFALTTYCMWYVVTYLKLPFFTSAIKVADVPLNSFSFVVIQSLVKTEEHLRYTGGI